MIIKINHTHCTRKQDHKTYIGLSTIDINEL